MFCIITTVLETEVVMNYINEENEKNWLEIIQNNLRMLILFHM